MMGHLVQQKNVVATTRLRSVSTAVYDSLVQVLEGKSISKKQRSSHDAAAYQLKGKHIVSLGRTRNSLTGSKEMWVMVKHKNSGSKTILLKTSEVDNCTKMYYNKYTKEQVQERYIVSLARSLLELQSERYKCI